MALKKQRLDTFTDLRGSIHKTRIDAANHNLTYRLQQKLSKDAKKDARRYTPQVLIDKAQCYSQLITCIINEPLEVEELVRSYIDDITEERSFKKKVKGETK